MRIDKTQRGWAIASLALLAVFTTVYVAHAVICAKRAARRQRPGLDVWSDRIRLHDICGAAWCAKASACLADRACTGMDARTLVAGIAELAGYFISRRISFWRHADERADVVADYYVVSGLFGAALQHYLPRVMTTDVKLETIYDEIENVRKLLREEADRAVETMCGPLGIGKLASEEVLRAGGLSAARSMAASSSGGAVAAAAETVVLSEEECAPLRKFYVGEMRPFLEQPKQRGTRLGNADKATRRIFRVADIDAAIGAGDVAGFGRHLRRGATTGAAGAIASMAARMVASAHSAFVGFDFAGGGACGDGAAVLKKSRVASDLWREHEQQRNWRSGST